MRLHDCNGSYQYRLAVANVSAQFYIRAVGFQLCNNTVYIRYLSVIYLHVYDIVEELALGYLQRQNAMSDLAFGTI
jgi:hypothetical protein